ncbi:MULTISPECIES: TIGR02611 family protein [Polymorphospora]|uniref:TIGR02611 family protein n=1 Tax=Polymorphospora lycopeni TaxID=3140240 RepID=A0ABV5D0V6_9ACTN
MPRQEGGDRQPGGAPPSPGVAPEPTTVAVDDDPPARRGRLRTTLDLIRSNPTGRAALRIGVGVTGAIVVIIGLILVPLPGPGWLIVIGGLAIWAVEFHWARRLLAFTRRHVTAWTRWVTRQSLLVRGAIALACFLFVSVVVWLSVKLGLGIDLVATVLKYLATN